MATPADHHAPSVVIVTTTVGSRHDAEQLARAVIEVRAAACVQLDAQVSSIYRWEGQVCEETEVRLTCKTTVQAEPALRALLAARHPYALPQLTSWRAATTADYARWVVGEVAVAAP